MTPEHIAKTKGAKGLFRYSGSKARILKHLPAPPEDTTAFVEPFAGSLAYAWHWFRTGHRVPVHAADANPLVHGLLEWLRTGATHQRLRELEAMRPESKVDVFSLGLSEPETTLLRLTCSGAYVGQLSSKVLYPQHSVDFGNLRDWLNDLREHLQPVGLTLESMEEACQDPRALCLIDPPYLNTAGNYSRGFNGMNPQRIIDFVHRVPCRVLLTYGDGAQDVLPGFDWKLAVRRKVPILRGGGTRDRNEFYATVRW